jgi:hypothetical protein
MFTGQGLVMFISWYFMIHCIINTFPISVKYLTILTFSFFLSEGQGCSEWEKATGGIHRSTC